MGEDQSKDEIHISMANGSPNFEKKPEAESEAYGPRLSAWLDGELDLAEASVMESEAAAKPALRKEIKQFRQVDVILKDWYEGLNAESAPIEAVISGEVYPARRRWHLLSALGTMVAAAVMVIAILPTAFREAQADRAAEAVNETAQVLKKTQGLRARFKVKVLTHRIDAGLERWQADRAYGEIRYGSLTKPRLIFQSEEQWTFEDDEPELIRKWGQDGDMQWLEEIQGGSRITQVVHNRFDLSAHQGHTALTEDRMDGSPIDIRTRRAVEGLACLLLSFEKDRYLKWMGLRWELRGGRGRWADPWTYQVRPFENQADGPVRRGADQVLWILQLSANDGGVIDRITLEEEVLDGASRETRTKFKTDYELEYRTVPWPKEETTTGRGSILEKPSSTEIP